MTAPIALPTRASAVPSLRMRPQLYLVQRGFIYSPEVSPETTSGFAAMILLSLTRDAFEVVVDGNANCYSAVAIKPLVPRAIHAGNVPILSIGLSPTHPQYRNFRAIGKPGALALDREDFAPFDAAFAALCAGQLDVTQAVQLFEDFVATLMQRLPPAKRTSRCIERALDMLQENPHYPLNELAAAAGLSYDRMSYLFAEAIGLPLRSYLLWQKIHVAVSLLGSGRPLTEIAQVAGFADSAHLSNAWQKTYGVSPSYFFNSNHVQLHSLCQQRRARQTKLGASA